METIQLIMILLCYPILWVLVGVLASYSKLKKGKAFGLIIPQEEWNSCDVALIIKRCRKVLLWCGVILTILIFPVLFISDEAIALTCWMIWFVPMLIVPFVFYGRYFNCMKRLKMAKGWEMTEEEPYWYGGLWYYNKDNPKVFISLFPGSNSLNLARLSGKIIIGFSLLCIVSMPFFGFAMIKAERTEMVVISTEYEVTAEHGRTAYTVAYDDVTEVALLREMPDSSRSVGYESTYLKKGNFSVEGYGSCSVCVDQRDPAILLLKTEEETYLFSFDTEAEALEIIDKIEIQ